MPSVPFHVLHQSHGGKQQAVNSILGARTLQGKHHFDSAEVSP